MGVQNAAITVASRNRIGANTRGLASWADLRLGRTCVLGGLGCPRLPNGRVFADGSLWRTDDGRVLHDFKLEPTALEV